MQRCFAIPLSVLAVVIAMAMSLAPARAAEMPADPEAQTPWHLYLTAKEAAAMKAELGNKALFVDVREPIEIMFTGFTDAVDVNVPLLLVNPRQWNPKRPVFLMEPNPNFAADIERALAERGLGKDAPVILMCRSGGDRGAPAARALDGKGYQAVYVVVDGFEGVTAADPKAPFRNVNGWKNSGLPWSFALNQQKIYTRQ